MDLGVVGSSPIKRPSPWIYTVVNSSKAQDNLRLLMCDASSRESARIGGWMRRVKEGALSKSGGALFFSAPRPDHLRYEYTFSNSSSGRGDACVSLPFASSCQSGIKSDGLQSSISHSA